MSTNNKWQALSMKDRAFLIREAVRNGITDINSIRDTWEHRFDGTGDTIIDGGTIPSVVVTPDSRYNKFVNSLPDNQRDTPESKYYTHLGWRLYGKPKNFEEAKQRGLYQWDNSDQSYHGVSVGWDDKADIGYFLKPKHHETVKYELDWYNKGLETLEGGEQRPLTGKDREFWQDFKSKYKLDESGSDYKYIPRQHTFDGNRNHPTEGPVDQNEIKRRQAWAESRFRDDVTSKAGAKGRFQIMENVKMDYIKAGGEDGDLYDPEYNEKVRDWIYSNLTKRRWINKENSTDSVKTGKALAAYNAGPTNIINRLNRAKTNGIDIDTSFDWLTTEYMPEETVDYVNWVLRNKPTGIHRNDGVYNLNKHKYSKNKK